jgi:hypothetical protein
MKGSVVHNELAGVEKPGICLEGQKKTTATADWAADIPGRTRSDHLLDMNPKRYRYANLPSGIVSSKTILP